MTHHQYRTITINGIPHTEKALNLLTKAYSSEIAVAGWEKKLFGFIGEWLSEEPIIEIQTSGSTGKPGIITVEKNKMVQSALRTGKYLQLSEGDKALLALPVSFIAGKMMVVRSFVLGLDLIPVNPTSNPLADLEQPIDFAALTPMQLFYGLASEKGKQAIDTIQKLIIGGGEINFQLQNKIESLKADVWHTYGMAETLTHVAMKKLNGETRSEHFKALPDVEFSNDSRGCLEITAKWLSDQKIVTNDLVELHDDNSFDFVGRFDNIINTGGIKISPELVEAKLSEIFQEHSVIIGLPDEALGQKIVLVIEGTQQPESYYFEKMQMAKLEKFEMPKEIKFLYQFPVTESGKVIRHLVREHILNQ